LSRSLSVYLTLFGSNFFPLPPPALAPVLVLVVSRKVKMAMPSSFSPPSFFSGGEGKKCVDLTILERVIWPPKKRPR
jgi:hypothetical protein